MGARFTYEHWSRGVSLTGRQDTLLSVVRAAWGDFVELACGSPYAVRYCMHERSS